MEWGILAVAVLFVVVGYIVLQGTRASMAWRKAASGGDEDVVRQILEDAIASWRSVKRPKDVAPDVWRGVQAVALVDVAAGGGRVVGPRRRPLPRGGWGRPPADRPCRRRRVAGSRRPAGAAAAMTA